MAKLMAASLVKSTSSNQKAEDESLFWGIWLRWSALNAAERLVCANIILMPVWWFVGLSDYMPLLMLIGISLHEWRRHGRLRLKNPSLVVITLFAFYGYYFIDQFLLFFNAHPSVELASNGVKSITLNNLVKSTFDFSLPCLIWYIQSNNVRVRQEVVAWACSVSAVQMLMFWIAVQFVFPGAFYPPPRSLYGILTGKSQNYVDGLGANNYLMLYDEGRFSFFFGNKQPCAAFLGFVGLIALDIKNRFWSLLLLAASIFLLTLPATRSLWVALPIVVFFRFLLSTSKFGGTWFLLALIAALSFTTLSVPPVTNLIFNALTDTATAVEEYRPGSTAGRSQVYKETLEDIPNKILFGHKVEGEGVSTIHGTGMGPKIGSHSFILGELLYKGGLVGFGMFATFWVVLFLWFYQTRFGRPECWFPVMLLYTFMCAVTWIHFTMSMGILVCMMLRKPAMKSLKRNAY